MCVKLSRVLVMSICNMIFFFYLWAVIVMYLSIYFCDDSLADTVSHDENLEDINTVFVVATRPRGYHQPSPHLVQFKCQASHIRHILKWYKCDFLTREASGLIFVVSSFPWLCNCCLFQSEFIRSNFQKGSEGCLMLMSTLITRSQLLRSAIIIFLFSMYVIVN